MEKPNMKVLMIAPLTAGIVQGGVRTQAVKTAGHLKDAGLRIDLFNPWDDTDLNNYDLVHIFVASPETLAAARLIRELKCKLVISPVTFTQTSSGVIRSFLKTESIGKQLFSGFFSELSIKQTICKSADLLLPNTSEEAHKIVDGFEIPESAVRVVPNGVDLKFSEATPDLFHQTYGLQDFVLFVGDASAQRKNVLKLLSEYKTETHPLVIIGKFDQSEYSSRCIELIRRHEHIHHLGPLSHDDPMLASSYAAASVFVLPSLYETPGIAALEAGLAGCKIAITQAGGTREVFGDLADYIDPGSPGSIIKAIQQAKKRSVSDALKARIAQNYSWKSVAEQTIQAYQSLFS